MAMLLLSLPFLCSLHLLHSTAQQTPRDLDALLQDYALRAFVRPKTGLTYDGLLPSNLSGIQIAAMRLRSGSLRARGVASYKEFQIPQGVIVQPYVERLVLVYHNLGNWSLAYYPLPGYNYLAPLLGLLAYDASNLSATNLPELDFRASGNPITIRFPDVKPAPPGSVPKCVWFDLNGSPSFSNVVAGGDVCSTAQQGHFSIAVESVAPSPAPGISPSPTGVPLPRRQGKKGSNSSTKVLIIVASVLGGWLLLSLLVFLVLWLRKLKRRKRMQQMERAAEAGETLRVTPVGQAKAPVAMVTRTQPSLESEYVP
ncbi:unnamed protein product [Linum tenue]|uniref:Uncharacterized protein n=1 Tax=Linum tenue TaxID=586396 RepID=A0AAV0JE94_9ROSI|nr:unnamed protein product [Linum tenue]